MKQDRLSCVIVLFFLMIIWSGCPLTVIAGPLHDAAQKGNIQEAQLLLDKGVEINAADENGLAALHHAAMQGHRDMVALLAGRGANVDVANQDGWTPLHYAIFHGKKDVVEELIARGADVDINDKKGEIPLFLALERDRQDIALLLIDAGADIHATADRGETLLHRAALLGQCEVAKVLLDRGFDVNQLHGYGWTPLHRAVRGYGLKDSHVDMVKLLVAHGAAIDTKDVRGCTPLNIATETIMMTSSQGEPPLYRIVKFLISAGADVNSKSRDGWPALHWAVGTAQKDVVQLLIAKGAEIDSTDWGGRTPLYWAVCKNRDYRQRLIDLTAEIKATTTDANATGVESPKQIGIIQSSEVAETSKDLARLLIAKGANVNVKDKYGDTPLIEAAKGADLEVVKLLVAGGADVDAKGNRSVTPLENAVRCGRADILEFLLTRGAQVPVSDKERGTLLLLAAQNCQKDTAKLLIANGADVSVRNESGVTPLGLAIGRRETKELPEAKYAPGYVKRGDYFYRQNEYDRAIEDYTTAIGLFQSNEDAYVGRGRAWAKKGDSRQAVSDWKKAIELNWATALDIYYHRYLLKSADAELGRLMQEAVKQHLNGLETVAGYAVGPTLVPSGFYTISLILSEPFDEEQFLGMARNDSPAVRAMALICLARHDRARHEETIRSFYTDRAEIEYLPYGCILSHITLGQFANSIIEHPNVLNPWSPSHAKEIANSDEADPMQKDTQVERAPLVETLISGGAAVNVADGQGQTPLHYAAQRGYRRVAELLIAGGAKVNASSNSGETPLHCATFWGYKDVVELLIQNGADVNLRTQTGSTALQIATDMRYQGLSTLLRERGAEK